MAEQSRTLANGLPEAKASERGEPRRRRLDEQRGLRKLLYELRYKRRRYRQFVGIVLVFLLTLLGRPEPALFWIGALLASFGMGVRMWASGFVMKNEVLATGGPYGFVRHPLYVGNILICAGFCAASGLWWSTLAALVVLGLAYPETIRYEDQKLQRLFRGDWDRWAAETRALLPRLRPYPQPERDEGSGWSLRVSSVRNGEPLHVVVLVGCLVYLFVRM